MLQQKNDIIIHDDEDFFVKLTESGGYVFAHMVSHKWSKRVYLKSKEVFYQMLKVAEGKGYELVFATSDEEKSAKFWKMMAPLEELNKYGPHQEYWIGAWHVEDTLNGH